MKPKADWTDNGKAVSISLDGNTVTIPILWLDYLAETLARMAYHGYIPHHTAKPGSDYGRKAKDVQDDHD